jgi:hypothetical protein
VNGVEPGVLVERFSQFTRLVEACRRYGNPGASSAGRFSTASSAQAWFSLDGTTRLARFNQDAGGDFHDWYSSGGQTPRVQDAFATPSATPDPTVELIALEVIGYHFMVPAITIANAGNGKETISWSPNTPGFVLQERTDLASATWRNSASGTNNPATITNTTAIKFFRVFHP